MLLGNIQPETIALTIPILFVMGGIAIAVVAILIHGRRKELIHKERLIAMEKGIEIPEEPVVQKREVYLRNRSGGIIMSFIGAAITLGLLVNDGWESGVWGLIPMSLGIGLLVSAQLEKRELERRRGSE